MSVPEKNRALWLVVSILVLVDLAREFYSGFPSVVAWCGFNPCFSGSCSRIVFSLCPCVINTSVSILVLVDLAREFDYTWIEYEVDSLFQSLF